MRSPSPGMVSQGRLSPEFASTSKHKTLGQVEWNRTISRAVQPFFIAQPTPDLRGTSGADKPRPHVMSVDIDRQPPRSTPLPVDTRDYSPVRHEEIHKRCGVDIGKAPARGEVFGVSKHNAETVVDAFQHPGWGKGKKSFLPKAPRDTFMGLRRWDTAQDGIPDERTKLVFSAYKKVPAEPPVDRYVLPDVKGGTIPKAEDQLSADQKNAIERPPLAVNFNAVEPHRAIVSFAAASQRAPKEKPSDKYRAMFRTPPPAPLATHEPKRTSKGFAPCRYTFRNSIDDILRTAAADVRRAQRLMDENAGERSRSPARSMLIYSASSTPVPSSSHGE